jgi:hypothetical protein
MTDVSFGSIASFWPPVGYFRSTPKSRHSHCPKTCLRWAKNKLMRAASVARQRLAECAEAH